MARAALAAILLLAASPAAAGPGSTAANFLKIGVGARPVSLGEAYTAVAEDVNAVYYNPAGLAFLERQEVTLMHNKFFKGVSQQWGGYAFPSAKFGTFAGAFTMLSVEAFDSYTAQDQPNGKVGASDFAGAAAWAFEFPGIDGLALGGSFKFINSRLAGYSADSAAIDAGLLYRQDEATGWRLGASVRNVGTEVRFISEAFPLPLTGTVGLSYRGSAAPLWTDASWMFTAEAVGTNDRNPYAAFGTEFRPVDEFGIRIGWRQNQDTGLGLAAGIGFRSLEKGFTSDRWPEIGLDYAFVEYGRLEHTHRVSLTLRFGTPKAERREGVDRRAPKFHHLIRY
ncbi:MAG: PorV/PorQ family protein [Elusimicrobia bacterium]|nr:PorV/PorQ family protein [Elusimicrobiota bacterium]